MICFELVSDREEGTPGANQQSAFESVLHWPRPLYTAWGLQLSLMVTCPQTFLPSLLVQAAKAAPLPCIEEPRCGGYDMGCRQAAGRESCTDLEFGSLGAAVPLGLLGDGKASLCCGAGYLSWRQILLSSWIRWERERDAGQGRRESSWRSY